MLNAIQIQLINTANIKAIATFGCKNNKNSKIHGCARENLLLCWGIYLERKTPVPHSAKSETRVKFPKKDNHILLDHMIKNHMIHSFRIANLAKNIKAFDFKKLLSYRGNSSSKGEDYA